MRYTVKIFKIFVCAFLSLCTYLDAATFAGSHSSVSEESLQDRKCTPLNSLSHQRLSPGAYESDDIGMILSQALENFEPEDVVIFDIDDVLITQRLDPFHHAHVQNQTALFERFDSLEKNLKDMFLFYVYFASQSPEVISIMDERTPVLIKSLQARKIRCIGNTACPSMFGPASNFDAAASRIRLLYELGIDFSCAFPHLELWNFDTLHEKYTIEGRPSFKQGIIFSGTTSKHITQHELFKQAATIPRRVMFIDDNAGNIFGMQDFMSSLGVECYSFCYSKAKSKPLLSYFSDEIYRRELRILESFVDKLLANEKVSSYFLGSYNREFIRTQKGWAYLESENSTREEQNA